MKYTLEIRYPENPSDLGEAHEIYRDRIFGIRLRLGQWAANKINQAPWWKRKSISRMVEGMLPGDLVSWDILHKEDRAHFHLFLLPFLGNKTEESLIYTGGPSVLEYKPTSTSPVLYEEYDLILVRVENTDSGRCWQWKIVPTANQDSTKTYAQDDMQ